MISIDLASPWKYTSYAKIRKSLAARNKELTFFRPPVTWANCSLALQLPVKKKVRNLYFCRLSYFHKQALPVHPLFFLVVSTLGVGIATPPDRPFVLIINPCFSTWCPLSTSTVWEGLHESVMDRRTNKPYHRDTDEHQKSWLVLLFWFFKSYPTLGGSSQAQGGPSWGLGGLSQALTKVTESLRLGSVAKRQGSEILWPSSRPD